MATAKVSVWGAGGASLHSCVRACDFLCAQSSSVRLITLTIHSMSMHCITPLFWSTDSPMVAHTGASRSQQCESDLASAVPRRVQWQEGCARGGECQWGIFGAPVEHPSVLKSQGEARRPCEAAHYRRQPHLCGRYGVPESVLPRGHSPGRLRCASSTTHIHLHLCTYRQFQC